MLQTNIIIVWKNSNLILNIWEYNFYGIIPLEPLSLSYYSLFNEKENEIKKNLYEKRNTYK